MSINARYQVGELDERIELQKEVRTPDGMGGASVKWVTQTTVWAHVRPLRGSERVQADKIQAEGGYLVVIRYRSDINEAWRVVWNSKTMNINFVQDNGKRSMYLPMECTAGVAT